MTPIRAVATALALALATVAAGCGGSAPEGGSSGPAPSRSATAAASPSLSTPTGAERCGATAFADSTPVRIPLGPDSLYGVQAGTGPRGIVLIHGSGQRGLCVWQQELPALAAAGFRVLAIDHRCVGQSTCGGGAPDLVADIGAAARHLRGAGATAVTVIGASAGTAQVIVAAAVPTVPIDAAVALSPGRLDDDVRRGGDDPRTARQAAPRIRVPVFYVVAADDRLSSVPETQALHDATPPANRELLSLPAGGHAQVLLRPDGATTGAPAGPVYDRLLSFLRRYPPG